VTYAPNLRRLSPESRRAVMELAGAQMLAEQQARGIYARSMQAEAGVTTEFASPEHERFYTSESPEVVASAWMGAGKSRILTQKAWDLALKHPGAELALLRKAQNSLTATTERTFWLDVADRRFVRGQNKTEHWVDIGTGESIPSRIWFLGLDADPDTHVPSKVGSLNLDWAGVDEAIELTEADWIMVGGRLRRQVIPYRQVAAATNPASPKHWLRSRFLANTPGLDWIALTSNRFLPDDYRQRIERMGSGVYAQRLAHGLWVAAEGAIWILPDEQISAPDRDSWKRVVAGVDWGFVHNFACEVVGESGAGVRATIEEFYGRGLTITDVIPKLIDIQKRWDCRFYADPSEPAYIEQCRRAGLDMVKANNDVVAGITAVTDAINTGMTVSPDCTGLLSEIPSYTWQTGREGIKEKPIETGDDACDAWRYANIALAMSDEPGWVTHMKAQAAAASVLAPTMALCGVAYRTSDGGIEGCARQKGHDRAHGAAA
jgi:PBSX family phage terminase large subunit